VPTVPTTIMPPGTIIPPDDMGVEDWRDRVP
jgi:hypothetical protein